MSFRRHVSYVAIVFVFAVAAVVIFEQCGEIAVWEWNKP